MTKNDFSTLISIRLENETLKAIVSFAAKQQYTTRSFLINMALRQLFVNSDDNAIWDFLYSNLPLPSCGTKN